MNTTNPIDDAAQAQEDHGSMVESVEDRRVFDGITEAHKAITESVRPSAEPKQPQVTDFTEIMASITQDGEFAVRVLLDSGSHIMVTQWVFKDRVCRNRREEAERLELAINQAMIEYHTKRQAWKEGLRHEKG